MYEQEPLQNNEFEQAEGEKVFKTFLPFGFTPKTFEEKRRIRKNANRIGVSLLILTAISSFWAQIYYLIMSKIGIDSARAYEIISEPAILTVVQICLSSLIFTLPFILIVKINGLRVERFVSIKPVEKGHFLALFFMGLGFCAFANIATSVAGSIFESFGFNYDVDFGENPKGIFGFLLSFIATAIVPALVEEFAMRGIVLGMLRKFGDGFAIITSAILFGLLHGNFQQMPFAFLVGLILGFIVVKTNSLLIAIAVHSANNFVSVVFDYLEASVLVENMIYIVYLLVCLLLGIVGIFLYTKQEGSFKLEKAETEAKESSKYKWFFASPVIIVFTVLTVIEAITFFFK